jgi:hypothetical protein
MQNSPLDPARNSISAYFPDALRSTMLKGYPLEKIAGPISTPSLAAILLPASLVIFAAVARMGHIKGTLTH